MFSNHSFAQIFYKKKEMSFSGFNKDIQRRKSSLYFRKNLEVIEYSILFGLQIPEIIDHDVIHSKPKVIE